MVGGRPFRLCSGKHTHPNTADLLNEVSLTSMLTAEVSQLASIPNQNFADMEVLNEVSQVALVPTWPVSIMLGGV